MATLVGGIFDEFSPLTGECRDEAVNFIGASVLMENKIGPERSALDGTTQNDVYIVGASGAQINEPNNPSSIDIVVSSVNFQLPDNVEHLILTGDANLTGEGNSGNNVLAGNNGSNTLIGGSGDDYLAGGVGNDMLIGDGVPDILNGELSNFAELQQDIGDLTGAVQRAGKTAATEGGRTSTRSLPDQGSEEGGNNGDGDGGVIIITIGGHHIPPREDQLDITDLLGDGGGVRPPIDHGAINNDTLCAGDGNDTLFGGGGNDVLEGEGGDDLMIGYFGNDTLMGGDGNDTLFGILGNDCISGGAGDDLIFSNGNFDTLSGGAGSDTFFFAQSNGSAATSTILDFQAGVDHLVFLRDQAAQQLTSSIEHVGHNTVLHYGNETVTLVGVTLPMDDDSFNIS